MMRKVKKAKKLFETEQISKVEFEQIISSYRGMLTHCKSKKISQNIESILKS
jgi:hypothetical protein